MAGHITDDAHKYAPSPSPPATPGAATPSANSRDRLMPTRTIAFLNQKGGVGKTTTVVNLAAALADTGRRVGVIDLDPQTHLTLHLGVEPDDEAPTVYDVLIDPNQSADDAFIQARTNLFVLPAEVDLAAAEVELAHDHERNRRLALKIRDSEIARHFDAILIDCPPSLGLLTLNALALAREVFVPMQAHFLALQGLSRLLETVGMVAQQVNRSLEVTGIILCMFEGNTRLATEILGDLTGFFESQRDSHTPWRNCKVLDPPIRRNIKLAESPSFGQSIFDYDPSCPGASDYRELAANVLRDWESILKSRAHGDGPAKSAIRMTPNESPESEQPVTSASQPVEIAAGAPAYADDDHASEENEQHPMTDDEAADIVVRHMQDASSDDADSPIEGANKGSSQARSDNVNATHSFAHRS